MELQQTWFIIIYTHAFWSSFQINSSKEDLFWRLYPETNYWFTNIPSNRKFLNQCKKRHGAIRFKIFAFQLS